jgi:hypothetical protein
MPFTRPLAGVTAVTLLVLALLALLPDCASACSCAILGNSPEERAEIALKESTAVFSGEVLDVEKGPLTRMLGLGFRTPSSRVTLRISEVWKGPQRETLEVSTPSQGGACGYSFSEGQKYLVYASGKEETFQTHLCSETKPLSKASADLEALGNGETLGSGGALVDTSGGFPPLGIIGMMGLAMAAVSLVVLLRLVRTG